MTTKYLDTGTDQLLCEIAQGVATVTFNRPHKRNALSDVLTPALRELLLSLETDTSARCIVITGAGDSFCAGGDVGSMDETWGESKKTATNLAVDKQILALQKKQRALTLRLFEHPKPTLASLPGPAAGAGLCIALACDLRIASESAFVTAAYSRLGLSGDYGGSWLLTQLVGPARAKEIYYTSRRLDSNECLKLGIFNEVVPNTDLQTTTFQMARSLAEAAPLALRYMKKNLNFALRSDLAASLDLEADHLIRCTQTEDHLAAIKAFIEKKRPTFKGK